MKLFGQFLTMLFIAGGFCSNSQAAENMHLFGTLIAPPPCSINNDQLVDVDFGERVGVTKVDGKNYLKTVDYRITCEPGVSGLVLGLTVTGPQTGFDAAALQTNLPDLGIRLLQGGEAFIINKRIVISADHPPVLQAVPVKKPGAVLEPKPFEVTATLLADYQ
ncbi:pilus assembly protein [Serratia marcescens]|uniref:fimbrial protein n=1 Tax=Serratia marcescens TaxID=615 RepID=UPI001151D8EA|nr:fimbrial protein [Serratia marcescens]QDI20297.1 pilus assembly protein [Serratia marcescens]QDI30041.1 pilus assembly protein [Serratia marcescens]QDI44545.1 pilus assembly protein [Serratia marcescens]QDI58970.1 pilus assembly protein [Serratia marcescens]QLJ67562.1 fimbrial protein [Serratia marcescens]